MSKLLTQKYRNNIETSKAFGKYYMRFLHTESLTPNEFVNHIREHGCSFDRGTILGVLATACDCLVELCLDSKKVQLGDLGIFYMSATLEGSEKEEDCNADNVTNVHLRFLPNLKREYPLDSVSMRKRASLKGIDQITGQSSSSTSSGSGSGSGSGEGSGDGDERP